MPERFGIGSLVRVSPSDPAHHTRAPRYVRGHIGMVVEVQGESVLPDDLFGGIEPPRRQAIYAVRFPARELWGAGDHTVTVHCWEAYLDSAEEAR